LIPKAVRSYKFADETKSSAANDAINVKFGKIATLGKNKKVVVVSVESNKVALLSKLANSLGGQTQNSIRD
jgi:hypothetical protein